MLTQVLEKLEAKIDNAIEVIELLRLQIEELEEKNLSLENDNHALKQHQVQWEQNLSQLLRKLEGVHLSSEKSLTAKIEQVEKAELEAFA